MKTLVYLNDQFLDGEEAKISALDLSILRGYGVMDYLRTYGGEPFYLRRHLERFIASSEALGLVASKTILEMEEIIYTLIEKTNFEETGIKVVLTGGVSQDQFLPEGPPTFFAVAYPHVPFPKKCYEEGVKLITECYQRPFPKAKSIHYLPAILGTKRALKEGAIEPLFYNGEGHLLETGRSNFFAIQNGEVVTPKEGVLEGITREIVLGISSAKPKDILKSEIPSFEGAFIASSDKEIMPVRQIDNHVINNGVIPLIIRNLMELFANHTKTISIIS